MKEKSLNQVENFVTKVEIAYDAQNFTFAAFFKQASRPETIKRSRYSQINSIIQIRLLIGQFRE